MSEPVLAVDFGTSNSAAAILDGGGPRILRLERDADTIPTAIFLDYDSRETLLGEAAIAAMIDGREGRFMRALKSVLGTSLLHEKRQFMNERLTLSEIITRFLVAVKARAEAEAGQRFDRVLAGRPVHFHHRDTGRDAKAAADLAECYHAAGFTDVSFLYEPQAAAFAAAGEEPGLGLVVDIGGGTSDFSVFRRAADGGFEVLANHGIRLGGTDFDRTLSLTHVMPLLGKGSQIRAELGPKRHEMPNAIYVDLATWAKIPFLYSPQVRRDAVRFAKLADERVKLDRLVTVLEDELGHDLAFATEHGKIAANGQADGSEIALNVIESGLVAPLTADALANDLAASGRAIAEAAKQCVSMSGVEPADLDRIVLVGGSSLLTAISDALAPEFPQARFERGNAFTAIIDGLALATARG